MSAHDDITVITHDGIQPARTRAAFPIRSERRSWLFRGLVGLAAVIAVVAGYLVYCIATIPHNGGLVVEPTPRSLLIESSEGSLFATRGVFKGAKLSTGDLPPHLARAIIAIEDRRFHEHGGLDVRGLIRAAWRSLVSGRREGGSTITQQLARMLYLSPERTVKRKVQEAVLALWLERQLGKEEILVRYLNTAYFGAGVYGVDAAAKRYFSKSAKDLSLSESAMLAGLVRSPSALAPHRNYDAARERAQIVLDAMVETGAVTQQQADAARREQVKLWVPPEAPPGTNYFVDTLDAEAKRLLGAAAGDLRLATTFDLKLQTLAESVINKRLAAEGGRRNVGQAALVAMAPDGAILAMVGGRDYSESQFNRVTQAKRQPGSLFKTFVYLAALQKGFKPDDVMRDQPVQIGDWEPENYGRRFSGTVTLRSAFARSINSVAVQLADEVGIKTVIEAAKRLGVQSDLPAVPSLALGSGEVTLMEMTRAFAALAAKAETVEPYAVRTIRGKGDQTLYTRPAAGLRAATDAAARQGMLELLAGVVNEGTGRAARVSGTVFGKTGTTQEHRDAWFVGFSGDLVVGVWIGNDDNTPTKSVTGGSLPAAIWRDFVSQAAPLRGKAQPVAAVPANPTETTGTAPRASEPAPVAPSARSERVLGPNDVTCERDRRGRKRCHVREPDSLGLMPPDDRRRRSFTRDPRAPEERDRFSAERDRFRAPRPGLFAPEIGRDPYRAPSPGGPLDIFGGGR